MPTPNTPPFEPQTHDELSPDGIVIDQQTKDREKQWEDREVHEKAAAGAHIVYRAILREADEELARPTVALAWSGLAAGLSMGFSLVGEGLLRSRLPDAPWRPLITKFGYSLGFLIVVLGRQQLFTENTLTPILPLLKRRNAATLWNVARLWVVVFVTNIAGAMAFAFAVQRTAAFDAPTRAAFMDIGMESMAHPFGVLLVKGIFAGWLIALMVWLLPVAETGRIWVIIFLTYVVGLGELSHIIAGSVEGLYTVAAGRHTFGQYFGGYMLPTLLGNSFGGVALVASLNSAQVTAGADAAESP